MRIDIVTLFPEMCENLLAESIIGRARARGHLQVCCHQLRRWGEGRTSAWTTAPSAAARACC